MNERLSNALIEAERISLCRKTSGFLYFAQCEQFTKIGVSINLPQRLCGLQIGNPFEVKFLKCFSSESYEQDEGALHEKLHRFWVRGEWFILPDGLLGWIIDQNDTKFIYDELALSEKINVLLPRTAPNPVSPRVKLMRSGKPHPPCAMCKKPLPRDFDGAHCCDCSEVIKYAKVLRHGGRL
jgi:hypothetical protein